MISEQEIRERVRARLVDGTMTQEQAAQVLQAWQAQQQPEVAGPPQELMQQPEPQPEPDQRGLLRRGYDAIDRLGTGFSERMMGGYEAGLSMGTGAIAEPVAGLAGLGALAGGMGAERASEVVEGTREGMTYQPRTESGQRAMGAVGEVLAPVGSALQAAEQFSGDLGYNLTGSPAVGAVTSAIPAAVLEIAGLRGTRSAKRAALERAVEESGASILTPDARNLLREAGITDLDMAQIAAADPGQLERMARFERLGIQPTRGDITQRLEAQKPEAMLLETAQDQSGNAMRQLRRQQSEALSTNLNDIIDSMGVPSEVGQSVKDALAARRTQVKSEATAAYQALAASQEAVDMPLLMGNFRDLPDMPVQDLRNVQRASRGEYNNLMDLLAEYGMNDDPRFLARIERDGVTPQALNISNFEDFRQGLAAIERTDQSGNISRITRPLREQLDMQVDAMSAALESSGNLNAAEAAKTARMNWRAYKTEFDPRALTEELISDRPRSTIPRIENSQVYNRITAPSVPIEQVDRVMESLRNAGPEGRRAVGDLQSAMVMDLLDSSMKGITRKIDGQQMISGPAMARRWDQIENKARLIFQDNPEGLARLQDVIQASADLTPASMAVPRGSAGFLMDAFQQMGVLRLTDGVPGVGAVIEQLRTLSERSANRTAFNQALKANPDLKRTVDIMGTEYPSLATALGIGYLSGQDDKE
jgi:hypothetical protein